MSETAEIIQVPMDKLVTNSWNPNSMPDPVFRALVGNVKRTGFTQPLLVRPLPDGKYEVVDGAHRYLAAAEEGLETISVVVKEMSDAEAMAQTLAMNKLRGEMEPADVAALIKEIKGDIALEELAKFTGYDYAELDALDKLADFDFSSLNSQVPDTPDPDDTWTTINLRVPESVELLFSSELERVQRLIDTDHPHMALEAIIANSANTPADQYLGEQVT